MASAATMLSLPSASSRSANEALTASARLSRAAANTATIPKASSAMIVLCLSAASSAVTYPLASTSATRPGHSGARLPSPVSDTLHPLADLFFDQAGGTPGHDGDDDGKGEHILVGACERQQYSAYHLQPREEEAAKDGAVNAAQPSDDGGGEANDAEVESDAEVDLVVVEAVHYPCEGCERRTDRKGDEHNSGEIDSHGACSLLVLRHGADGETKLGAIEEQLQPNNHQRASRQHHGIVEAQIELGDLDRALRQQRGDRLGIGALRIKKTHR